MPECISSPDPLFEYPKQSVWEGAFDAGKHGVGSKKSGLSRRNFLLALITGGTVATLLGAQPVIEWLQQDSDSSAENPLDESKGNILHILETWADVQKPPEGKSRFWDDMRDMVGHYDTFAQHLHGEPGPSGFAGRTTIFTTGTAYLEALKKFGLPETFLERKGSYGKTLWLDKKPTTFLVVYDEKDLFWKTTQHDVSVAEYLLNMIGHERRHFIPKPRAIPPEDVFTVRFKDDGDVHLTAAVGAGFVNDLTLSPTDSTYIPVPLEEALATLGQQRDIETLASHVALPDLYRSYIDRLWEIWKVVSLPQKETTDGWLTFQTQSMPEEMAKQLVAVYPPAASVLTTPSQRNAWFSVLMEELASDDPTRRNQLLASPLAYLQRLVASKRTPYCRA